LTADVVILRISLRHRYLLVLVPPNCYTLR
jgi:hypothetical protein